MAKRADTKQLKSEQQLTLSKIQHRVLRLQLEAKNYSDQARTILDQAKAADMEFGAAVMGFAKQLGVRLGEEHEFDFDKLQFKPKSEPPVSSAEEIPAKKKK